MTTRTTSRDQCRLWIATLIHIGLWVTLTGSELHAQQSSEDLATTAANPLGNLMSFPFQNNTNFGIGTFDRASNALNVQPVIPLAGGRIITRTIFPFVRLPDITSESGSLSSGLGDILMTAFYVPPGGGLTWGVGPVLEVPSGGANRGSKKWSAGISGVALAQPGDWTLGVLANNVWSVAGDSDREAVNKGLLQYFIVYQLGQGWYVNSAPAITVNWKAANGQQWVVPVGAGGGKVIWFGKLPVNFQAQAYYNAVKPDLGADWTLRVQVQFLLPTNILGGGGS